MKKNDVKLVYTEKDALLGEFGYRKKEFVEAMKHLYNTVQQSFILATYYT